MKQFCEQLDLHNQHQPLALILPSWQLALNLMGRCDNPLVLSGEALNEQSFYDRFLADNGEDGRDRGVAFYNWQYVSLQLAYIFQDLEQLEIWFQKKRLIKGVVTGSHFSNMLVVFFSGLAGFSLYRATKKRKYLRKARHAMNKMKMYCKTAGINAIPLRMVLLAEMTSTVTSIKRRGKLKNQNHVARSKRSYDEAIATLGRCGLIHLEALACERAGDFFMSLNNNDNEDDDDDRSFWSQTYYDRARLRYLEWGATAKAEQLNVTHNLLQPLKQQFRNHHNRNYHHHKEDSSGSNPVSVRGKQRYDPSTWRSIDKTDSRLHGSQIMRAY